MEEEEVCILCNGLGLTWDEDSESYLLCPNGCEDTISEDPLLNDKSLFPDELPEENKRKWD